LLIQSQSDSARFGALLIVPHCFVDCSSFQVHDFELHFNADAEGTYEWIDLNEQRRLAEAEAPVSPSSLNFSREVSGLTSQDTLTFSRNNSAEHGKLESLVSQRAW